MINAKVLLYLVILPLPFSAWAGQVKRYFASESCLKINSLTFIRHL